jgi:hypothetical protein
MMAGQTSSAFEGGAVTSHPEDRRVLRNLSLTIVLLGAFSLALLWLARILA